MSKRRFSRFSNVFFLMMLAVLVIYSIVFFCFFGYGVVNSFKSLLGFINDPVGLPEVWKFDNYITVLKYFKSIGNDKRPTLYLEHMLGISIIYSLICTSAFIIASVLMSYACGMFDNIVSRLIKAVVIFTMIFPIIGASASEMTIVKRMGIWDTWFGMFFLKFNFGGAYFLILSSTFKGIPIDFKDAASIDGASNLTIMLKLYLPMAMNIIGAIFLVTFIGNWNDYATPGLYLPSYPTVALGLLDFSNNTSGEVAGEPVKLAAAIMVLIPILLLFILVQKKLMGNLTEGGIKG